MPALFLYHLDVRRQKTQVCPTKALPQTSVKKMIGKQHLIIIGVFILVTISSAGQSFYFDHYTSPANNELVNNFSVRNNFVQIVDSGITGGCIEVVHAADKAEATLNSPITWTSLGKINISVFFKFIQDTSTYKTEDDLSLKILIKDSNGHFTDSLYSTALSFHHHYINTNPLPFTQFRYVMNTAVNLSNFMPDSIFKHQHWYKLSITLDKNFAGDTVQYSYTLQNFGKRGYFMADEPMFFRYKHGWSAALKNSTPVKFNMRANPLGVVRYLDNLFINEAPLALPQHSAAQGQLICYPNPISDKLTIEKKPKVPIG